MINVSSYRKMDNQLDVLGNTTWGIRKVRDNRLFDLLSGFKKARGFNSYIL